MQVSAEMRWFWRDDAPAAVTSWFRDGTVAPGGGTPRRDVYLLDAEAVDLGIKARGNGSGVEIKGRVEVRRPALAGLDTPVEVWAKWQSAALRLDGLPRVTVGKRRWLRKFDTGTETPLELALDAEERLQDRARALPTRGCHVELVAITVEGPAPHWTSLAFEAFGPLPTVDDALARTLRVLPPLPVAALAAARVAGYPEWLRDLRRDPTT